jgi:dGTPase
MSASASKDLDELREYLFTWVYFRPEAHAEEEKIHNMIQRLYTYYLENISELPPEYRQTEPKLAAADYIAGMTDRFAIREHERLTGRGWLE